MLSFIDVSGSSRSNPNFAKVFLIVLSLNLRASVSAQDCLMIHITLAKTEKFPANRKALSRPLILLLKNRMIS